MWKWIAMAAFAIMGLAAPTSAEACTCLPQDIVQGYRNYDHVIAGRVLRARTAGQWLVYDVWLWQTAKSCLPEGRVVQVGTHQSSAACGTTLQVGGDYVLFAQSVEIGGVRRAITNSCAPNTLAQDITLSDWEFLGSRQMDCPDQVCSGGQPLAACFTDPCLVSSCAADPTATCEPNYCGGCYAEWYSTSEELVCVTP